MASAAALARPRLAMWDPNPHARNPRDHAIVVGINHYRDGISPLQGALNDCSLFCEWLIREDGGGLDPANIDFYGSMAPTDHAPHREEIEDLLLEFFVEHSQTGRPVGRRLYLYFSGHGVGSTDPLIEECGFVVANAATFSLRALAGKETAIRLRVAALFEEVVLIMDCCRDVTHPPVIECGLPRFGDSSTAKRPFLHIFAAGWGATTAEKILPNPLDPDGAPLQHGILTHALLKALRTARDSQGQVTAASLKPVVRKIVQDLLGPGDVRFPEIQFDEDLPPISFGASRGARVDVSFTAQVKGFQVRHGDQFRVLAPEIKRTGKTAKVWLAPGMYLFEGLDQSGEAIRTQIVKVLPGGANVDL